MKWSAYLFLSLLFLNLTPFPVFIQIRLCHMSLWELHFSFLAVIKKAQRRSWLFFAWQNLGSLSKHAWLANDNLSSDMSRNQVSQNPVLRERRDRVGEDGNDRKRRANTALCYSVCFPQACDKVKLSPPGWHASRRHFEVNTSQGCGSEIWIVASPVSWKHHSLSYNGCRSIWNLYIVDLFMQ